MGTTKTALHTPLQTEIARFAKALGHPARVAILQELLKKNTCQCGQLVSVIGLAQPTISQHLRELKDAGLIKGSIAGKRLCYCIDAEAWHRQKALLEAFLQPITQLNSSCCDQAN